MEEGRLNHQGLALVMVLWVMTLLAVIAGEFCFSARTELNVTRNFKETGQLYFYAQGGIHRGIAELTYRNDPALRNQRQNLGFEMSEGVEMEWRVDGTPYTVPFRQGETEVRLRSENGRINLNRVPDAVLKKVITYFVEAGQERDVIVDSILDWRDRDDFHRVNGAENDYYRSLPEPYDCKDGDFDSVEELLLVRGITAELFYGKKARDVEEMEKPVVGLRDIFTVFSTASNVDINAASAEVIMVLFGIPLELAKRVVETREEKAFANAKDLTERVPDLIPFLGQVQAFIGYSPTTPYFNILSVARMREGESRRGVECVLRIDRQEKGGYRVVLWKDYAL